MLRNFALRVVGALAAGAAGALPSHAIAQEWSVQSGATAQVEYSDNYFFTITDTQSGFTASITPFVTAARQTETSEVVALVAVGVNRVWGLSPTVDYMSGRLGLGGSAREARSTWTGSASFVRSPTLQNESGQVGAPLVLAFTNGASVIGTYTYALTERWSLGPTLGAFSNRYEGVESGTTLSNNHGYFASGNVGYAYSDNTQFTFAAAYTNGVSDVARSNVVTATIGVVHQFSPQLTISASLGRFWSDIEATNDSLAGGNRRHDDGGLYGGSISYALSERTQFDASLSENLTPSGSGTLIKSDVAGVSLTHRLSDRLTGRLGASYTRATLPATISSSVTNNNYLGEIGFSYLLAEHWKLDAGYRYAGARYEQSAGEPRSNIVFVSIGYNWPGASFTDWVGRRPDTQGLPGAGPVLLPAGSAVPPSVQPESTSPERSPFDPFTVP